MFVVVCSEGKAKVIDLVVKSKVCKACEKWVGKEKMDEYLEWHEDHMDECTANHESSSGKMEVDGVIEMFRRSVEWFSVKYKRYVGDSVSDDLLKRCLSRNTQNNNEASNHCVWNLAPKHIFVGQKTLELAAWTAAYTFNEGFLPVLQIMETMDVTIAHTLSLTLNCIIELRSRRRTRMQLMPLKLPG